MIAVRAPLALAEALLDAFLPPRCALCRAVHWDPTSLCPPCAARLPPASVRCPACGRQTGPYAARAPCGRCRAEDLRLDGVVAAWPYEAAARELVLALKFKGRLGAAEVLGRGIADAAESRDVPGDLVVPVPLSRRRHRRRGFDQALLVASVVAKELDLPWDPHALLRVRDVPPQTSLAGGRRRRSPRGAFRADRARVRSRSVLLVDDVLTTGATARAAAVALRRAGAQSVVAAVAARTEGGGAAGARVPGPAGVPAWKGLAPRHALLVNEEAPVIEVSARFADEVVAGEAADALNRWFRWILDGSPAPVPLFFEPMGVASADWAWSLEDDVDWQIGPRARAVGDEVRVALETHDTHLRLSGLLRALGARAPRVTRA